MFQEIYEVLRHRKYVVEDVDVYSVQELRQDGRAIRWKYRELKRFTSNGGGNVETQWDRKSVKRYVEQQVPHVDHAKRRVVFVTAAYKTSHEDVLTSQQWQERVREDHTNNSCLRVYNKHRLAFGPDSFSDLFAQPDTRPPFTRLSLGEYSTYGGTLEARTRCNPIYYLEIEHELERELNDPRDMGLHAELLVETLFTVFPYDLIAKTMRKDAAATVQREWTDNVFDEFKRRFVNYDRFRGDLWKALVRGVEGGEEGYGRIGRFGEYTEGTVATGQIEGSGSLRPNVDLFVMPKWDGLKATANYCDGYLFVKDACGSLSTFVVDLPFDNDVILQLELVNDDERAERLFVVTEILAVVVKTHDTLYHVYNRNNTVDDTGRYAGNVSTSITLKTQLSDPNNRCNTYRLVKPRYSLLTFHYMYSCANSDPPREEDLRQRSVSQSTTSEEAIRSYDGVNTYTKADRILVLFTTVTCLRSERDATNVLRLLDRVHNYMPNGDRLNPTSGKEEVAKRTNCLWDLSLHLPMQFLRNERFRKHCEGLLVTFVRSDVSDGSRQTVDASTTVGRRDRSRRGSAPSLPDHGYIKVKPVDTIELEYDLEYRTASSASGRHVFIIHDVPAKLPGWAERPRPVANNRVIVECYYDRDRDCLVYVKDRPDKNKADSEEKISAINPDIISRCAYRHHRCLPESVPHLTE